MVWPTPNPAMLEGRGLATFVQPTASGRLESALWGCVRNSGTRFHEGLDLKTLERDSRGEATDPVFAVLDGVVAHINPVAGNSSYGRYIVIEHPDTYPHVYTLYAHMARMEAGLSVGDTVQMGQTIGIMGRSAGGYSIPRSRAHLHFEIGLRLSEDFQEWYDEQGFGSKNHHGNFNGMNLVGWDPLDYYRQLIAGRVVGPASYLDREPTALSLRVHTSEVPDFLRRYPVLISGNLRNGALEAWDIDFTWYGLPKRWVPRYAEDGVEGEAGTLQLLSLDKETLSGKACKTMVTFPSENRVRLGGDLKTILELLFKMY